MVKLKHSRLTPPELHVPCRKIHLDPQMRAAAWSHIGQPTCCAAHDTDGLPKWSYDNRAQHAGLRLPSRAFKGNSKCAKNVDPTPNCDTKTTKLSGNSCRCVIRGMVPVSKTSCACPDGQQLKNGACSVPPPPPPKCDGETAKLQGNRCVCTIRGMVPVSKTSCSCPNGQKIVNGRCAVPPPPPPKCDGETAKLQGNRCVCTVRGMVPVSKTSCACPKGQKIVNGRCTVPPPPPPKCDGVTAVPNGKACVCRFDDMRKRNATSCGCAQRGARFVRGKGCIVERVEPPREEVPTRHYFDATRLRAPRQSHRSLETQ